MKSESTPLIEWEPCNNCDIISPDICSTCDGLSDRVQEVLRCERYELIWLPAKWHRKEWGRPSLWELEEKFVTIM
jgi:hypothetical protein